MKLTAHASDLLDETYYRTRLKSGLTVFVFPKPGMQKKIAVYGTRYGSIDNDFASNGKPFAMPAGIAHFLEHQMFKKEHGDLLVEFSKTGANSNAATEYSTTCYYFTCIDRFTENLSTLTDLCYEACFKDEWVEKEKLIIEQELRMYRDMPDMRIYQNLQESLYRRHPARLDIGGTVESIKEISRAQLETCWRTFYAPSNMVLDVAGDVEPGSVVADVEEQIAKKKLDVEGRIRRMYPREPKGLEVARREEAMSVARPKFLMGFREEKLPRPGREATLRELEVNFALECLVGRGSALYNRLYGKGLIDESFSTQYSVTPSFGGTYLGGETDDPEALEAALVAGIAKFLKEGVRRRDLDRIRRKYLGGFLRGFDSVEQCAFSLLRFHFKGLDVFELPAMVKHVSRAGVMKAARAHLKQGNRALSVVVPKAASGLPASG